MKYRALTVVWHTKDEKHYQPGDEFLMDHLPAEKVETLVSRGVIEPAEQRRGLVKPPVEEKKED